MVDTTPARMRAASIPDEAQAAPLWFGRKSPAARTQSTKARQTRLNVMKERSVSLPTGAIEPQKLAAYLTAFDALDSQMQSAYVAKIDYGQGYPDIATAVGAKTPEDARVLVSQAVTQLSASVLGVSETNSQRLVELFEATALAPNSDVADGDFEKEALRELANIASVVAPHRQPDFVSADHQNTQRAWGKFAILAPIDAGGFGTVYRAWDPDLEHTVALKLYHPHRHRSKVDLLSEARKLARVRHHNVVVVHGAEEHAGQVGVWMELIEGRTLREEITWGANLAADDATEVGIALCQALEAVHAAGVIHGDIKAQNIMRDASGRVVLMDFGAARLRDPAIPESIETIAGTKQYMAPELFDLQEPSVASDIYALGVLLFHLVTGKYPVRGDTGAEIRHAHERGEPMLSLGEARPELPAPFARVVEQALARSSQERWPTAQQMQEELVATRTRRRLTVDGVLRAGARAAGAILLVMVLGFAQSGFFQVVLGIHRDFWVGPADYFLLGIGALLPVLYLWVELGLGLLLLLVPVGIAWVVARALGVRIPLDWQRFTSSLDRADPRITATLVLMCGTTAWALITWSHLDVFDAFERLYTAPSLDAFDASALGPSSIQTHKTHLQLSCYLALGLALAVVLWFPRLQRTVRDAATVKTLKWLTLGVVFLAITTVSLGRRVIFEPYEVVEFAGKKAHVVGERDGELLLLPGAAPDREFWRVRPNDPQLRRIGVTQTLFADGLSENQD